MGYIEARRKLRIAGKAVKRNIFFQTFIVEVNADNMEDVCAMSRQINDNNIELNSRKSAAQEVIACYEINDKTQEEMDKIVTPEVRHLLLQ